MTARISRRTALAGVAALPAAGIVSAQAAIGSDEAVVTLAARYVGVLAESDSISLRYADFVRMPPDAEAQERALVREGHRLRAELGRMRAVTPAGIRAKATALLRLIAPDPVGPSPDDDDFLAWSICRDLTAANATG